MKLFYRFFLIFFSLLSSQIQAKSPIYYHSPPPPLFLPQDSQTFHPPDQRENQQIPACPCQKETEQCPPCNPFEFTRAKINCPCAPKINCPPCILAKTQKYVHEQAEKEAKAQAQTEESLSREAQLQSKLFQLAMKFAKEASQQEEIARKAALALQQASSKAQIARNKMKRATNQARLLAIKAISTISSNQLDKLQIEKEKKSLDSAIPQSIEDLKMNSELEDSLENPVEVGNEEKKEPEKKE